MSITALKIGDPFFSISYIENEPEHAIIDKTIVLNLSETAIQIQEQTLGYLQSVVVINSDIRQLNRALLIEKFASHGDDEALFDEVKKLWPLAYDIRKEERLKGVSHYMGPKIHIGNIGLGLYHSGSVPLNVGLHKDHPWCEAPGYQEVHTQIVGYGKMQQCRERDIATLYLEEPMAPGTTHKPMFDKQGNYPWHQYETITPSIFMAIEILPTA